MLVATGESSVPILHLGVCARSSHFQTADAIAYVPPPAAAGGGSSAGGDDAFCGAATCEEDVLVSCGGKLVLWRLGAAAVGSGVR